MISVYLSQRTWLHAVSAGVKLLTLAGLSTALLPVTDWRVLVSGLVVIFAVYGSLGSAALGRIWLLRPTLPFLVLIGIVQALTISWESGVSAVARLVLMVLLADLVTMTTTMQALMSAIMPVLRPLRMFGVNPKKMTLAVALVIRFVPVLLAMWEARVEAWRARTGKRVSLRLIAPFIGDVLRMTEHVAEALDARGFDAKNSRSR